MAELKTVLHSNGAAPAPPTRQEQAVATDSHADWEVLARSRLDLLMAQIGPIVEMQAEAERIHAALVAAGSADLPEITWPAVRRKGGRA